MPETTNCTHELLEASIKKFYGKNVYTKSLIPTVVDSQQFILLSIKLYYILSYPNLNN